MSATSSAGFHILKPRNILTLFASAGFVLGISFANSHIIAIAMMSLAVLVISAIEARSLLSFVMVERTHQKRAFQNQSVAVKLVVKTEGSRSPELLLIEDYFPPSSNARYRRLVEFALQKGRRVELNYYGACEHRRGLYVLGPVRLQAYDSFGFFLREALVEEFTELIVYPQAVDLDDARILGEGTLAHVGLDMTRRSGHSEEFLGVREYRVGDPLRLIHWRLSARHGSLIVKEFQEEMTTLVSFFLDLGKMSLAGVGDQTSVEYGIKCCASLAKHAVEHGHAVQFFGIAEKVEHIPAGSGTTHLLTLLDRLALVRAQGESAFAIRATDFATSLPGGSTAVYLLGATTANLDVLSTCINILADQHILPIFVVIDDRAFIKVFREQEDAHHRALPLEDIARSLTLMGARVHVVRRNKSMEQALLHGLSGEGAA